MDWFRSWHGAPTDPKWLVIARRSNTSPGMVSALAWALLDYASQHASRGSVDGFDVETYAAFTGWEEDQIEAILDAMRGKGIITEDNRLASWEKRQPKREDPGSNDRVTEWRKRQRDKALQERDSSVTPESVTHGNARKRIVTPDKIDTDKIERETDTQSGAATPSADADTGATPGTLGEWHDLLRADSNKVAVLRRMFDKLFPSAVDVPDYARLGKTAKQVGGAGRLAELMWTNSAKPPSGDVMAYLVRVSKNGAGRNGNDPKRMAETQTDYDALKARYAPKHLEELIEH